MIWKNRSAMPSNIGIRFNNYLSRKDRDITRLYEYASQLRVGKKIDELIKFIL